MDEQRDRQDGNIYASSPLGRGIINSTKFHFIPVIFKHLSLLCLTAYAESGASTNSDKGISYNYYVYILFCQRYSTVAKPRKFSFFFLIFFMSYIQDITCNITYHRYMTYNKTWVDDIHLTIHKYTYTCIDNDKKELLIISSIFYYVYAINFFEKQYTTQSYQYHTLVP